MKLNKLLIAIIALGIISCGNSTQDTNSEKITKYFISNGDGHGYQAFEYERSSNSVIFTSTRGQFVIIHGNYIIQSL